MKEQNGALEIPLPNSPLLQRQKLDKRRLSGLAS